MLPDNFYFYRDENGEVTIDFNGKEAPTLRQVQLYYAALGKFIDQWDEEAIAEYNQTVKKEWEKMQESSYEKEDKKITPGLIYLLKCVGLYKLGKTKNLKKRLRKYVTENPHPIEVIHTKHVEDYTYAENVIGAKMEPYRLRGEWYRLTDLQAQLFIGEINKL